MAVHRRVDPNTSQHLQGRRASASKLGFLACSSMLLANRHCKLPVDLHRRNVAPKCPDPQLLLRSTWWPGSAVGMATSHYTPPRHKMMDEL